MRGKLSGIPCFNKGGYQTVFIISQKIFCIFTSISILLKIHVVIFLLAEDDSWLFTEKLQINKFCSG